jgi:hypothetical protein
MDIDPVVLVLLVFIAAAACFTVGLLAWALVKYTYWGGGVWSGLARMFGNLVLIMVVGAVGTVIVGVAYLAKLGFDYLLHRALGP